MRRLTLAAAAALTTTAGLAAGQTAQAPAEPPAVVEPEAPAGGSDPMLAGAVVGTFAGVLIIFLLAAGAD